MGWTPAIQAEAPTPRRGGILHLGFQTDWRSLDPAIGFDAASIPFIRLMFRGLITYDDQTGLVPDQARDWQISPDGLRWTFHLREGVRFSHGREVEASDYIYSFERLLDPNTGSPGQTYLLNIAGATEFSQGRTNHVTGLHAPDKRTLEIRLLEPQFTFRYVLAMAFTAVLPREVIEQYGKDFGFHLTGTGPYRLARHEHSIRWILERNPYYQGADGYVDGVEIIIGPDPTLLAMMLERGEIDRTEASPAEAVRFLRDPSLKSWVQSVDTVSTGYLFMNTEIKPFDDVRVRRAVNHALSKERLIRLVAASGVQANGIIPPAMPWSNPQLPHYDYNPAKARALLAEAGYPDGFKADFWYILSRPKDVRISGGIQQDLKEVGIDITLRPVSYPAFEVKTRSRKQAACGYWGWMQDYPDPSTFLDVLLSGGRITEADCNNVSFYNNPEVDRRLDLASKSANAADRQRWFAEAETITMNDAPWVPVLHEQIPMLTHPRLHGTAAHPVWLWRYEYMWLDP
jgi:peptide/nickel transport system substrate-binding protein